jgi:hypothetical protein
MRVLKTVRQAIAVAAGIATGCAGAATSSDPTQAGSQDLKLGDPTVRTTLRNESLSSSRANGVQMPTTMLAVASTDRQTAERLVSGDIVADHSAVYVVAMTGGTFTAVSASSPPGASPPQGTVLTVTFNATTLAVTDVALLNSVPDLTAINPDVVNLLSQ